MQEIVAQPGTEQGIMGGGFAAVRFCACKPLICHRKKIRLAGLRVRTELHQIRRDSTSTRRSPREGMK